ncbi:hypothetical protein [Gimesia algae]|uniref:Uncharacterized protein n=1 Tax=Gimesia algae TaxID=2527971 RepID=A0A517VMQ1_9PLAN|nr:hypothetical protein [Gimesia algae]QDT94190.1 hypothetical protein Pan161_58840 [Gimesia algae]
MKDFFKGLGVVTALVLIVIFTAGSIGCFIELKQLQDECTSLGYGGYHTRDGKHIFYLYDSAKSKTKADRRPSEARPCGDLAGRKIKMASQ